MPIALPPFSQDHLGQSPLQEVVCQLRFSPILRIGAEQPVDFQERIRGSYPRLAEERGVELATSGSESFATKSLEPTWQFKSSDNLWTASLTSTFVALKTTGYVDIEDFLKRLAEVKGAFEDIYVPPFYTRIGLRYVNRLILAESDGEPVPWEDYLNKHLAGVFSDPVLSGGIVEANHHLVLQTADGQIGWRYQRDMGIAGDQAAERYTLDFDHYLAEELECAKVEALLGKFNDSIYRLFRWCFTDSGYEMLKPRSKKGAKRP